MSKNLVTLDQAKDHIRAVHDMDDEHIELAIKAASAAVLTYLDGADEIFTDSNGDVVLDDVPDDIKWACLLLIGEFFRNREAEQDGPVDQSFGYGFLPRPVVALLFPHRDQPIA